MDRERRLEVARAAQDNDVEQDAAPDRMRQAAMVKRKATAPTSGGSALDGGLRAKMEKSLGSDLSGVRLHTDAEAGERSKDLGARAYTEGADVHFAAGEFNPGTKEGDRLIAHELTHVVQGGAGSGGGAAAQAKSAGCGGGGAAAHRKEIEGGEAEEESAEVEVSDPEESAEKEADAVADQAVDEQHEGKESEGAEMGGAEKKDEPPKIQAKLDGAARKVYRWNEYDRKDKGNTGAEHTIAEAGQFPGVSDATKEKSKDVDPKKLQQLEAKIGAHAFSSGAGVGQALTATIERLLKTEIQHRKELANDVDQDAEIHEEVLTKFAGSGEGAKAKTVAGAVENDGAVLQEVLSGGNLREQMTVVMNFMGKFQDLVLGEGGVVRDEMAQQLKDKGKNLTKRCAEIRAGQEKKGLAVPEGGGVAQEKAPKKPEDKDKPDTFANPRLTEANKAMGLQDSARTEQTDGAKTNPTPEELQSQGVGLSEREKAFMGDQVEWRMGIDSWKEKDHSEFVEKMAALKLPFAAGPSGTTARICDTAGLLGESVDENLRLACIGYLLPIQAHSLWEVVEGAKTKGIDGPSFAEDGIDAYDKLGPIQADIKQMKLELGLPVTEAPGAVAPGGVAASASGGGGDGSPPGGTK